MKSINEFLKLTEKYNVIPVFRETIADLETPLSAYMKIDNPEYSFLLESVEGGERIARYSFLGREPFMTFFYKNGQVCINSKNEKKVINTTDPLKILKEIFDNFKVAPVKGLPRFHGGAVGYIGYDIVKLYEKIPQKNKIDDLNWPDLYFMFADILMVFDHIYHKIQVVYNVIIEKDDTREDKKRKYNNALKKIDSIIKELNGPLKKIKLKETKAKTKLIFYTKKEEFKNMVKKTVNLIKNGEAIQVVLSQRFKILYSGDPLNIYRSLRIVNPSPYMHYLRFGDILIIGASPELMVRVENGKIELRPIAGTRKRGKTEEEDKKLEIELLNNEKEKAEHIMLVDLGRNDVGRVSEIGTVKVKDLMVIERYSHVMHIVSSVEGKLKKGKDIFDVLKSTFPAGTVSGAPKVRAMQIIEEMEKVKRGPYAGIVGYISFSKNLDSCISIRSIYFNKNKAIIQAGAGIVADSKSEKEYEETINKAKALFKAIELSNSFIFKKGVKL